MKRYLAILGLIFASCSPVHSNTNTTDIAGIYDCSGTEIDQKTAFQCELTLEKTDQTYASSASCDDRTRYTATGIYDAKKRILSLVSVNLRNPQEVGVAMVNVNKNGSLTSSWTYLHQPAIGHTNCIRRKN